MGDHAKEIVLRSRYRAAGFADVIVKVWNVGEPGIAVDAGVAG